MSLIHKLRGAAVTRIQSVPRRARRRMGGRPVAEEPLQLVSAAGYRIAAKVTRPTGRGPWPAVLLCPGTNDPGTVFDGWSQPVNAREIASRGWIVLHFDPAGRGESWGEEDYGGLEHQDNVRACLAHLRQRSDLACLGVLSISMGVAMAVGAVARFGEELGVDWLIDWEGPCDREIITAGGTIMAPAMGHNLEDEAYWKPREAVRSVGSLPCGYVRIQAERDHAQPGEFRHAERMIEAAAAGSLPWFQLNDHPRGEAPIAPVWYAGGRSEANRVLLRHLDALTSG